MCPKGAPFTLGVVHISKELFTKMQMLEARGTIPEGTAAAATFAVIAERSCNNMMEGYYGKKAVDQAYSLAKEEQAHLDASDAIVADVRQLHRVMEATHTTSDFPVALANLRTRTVRDGYSGTESMWRDFANIRTTPDFKPIRSLRFDEAPELLVRPEGTDVQYLTLKEREDGYRVANYERAIKYTWENWVNDEVGLFAAAWRSFGRGARRTEVMVVFSAIRDGLPRTVLTAGAGVPTVDRLKEMQDKLTARTFIDADGNSVEHGFVMTDVIHGTREAQYITSALKREFLDFQGGEANPVSGAFTPHLERQWGRALGRDIVGFDSSYDWLEVSFMQGFEGGPKTYVKMPDTQDYPDEGDFEDHTLKMKMGHTLGASVIEPSAAIRVEGAA